MIRRVGLDLDNTIINYDHVFVEAALRFGHVIDGRSKSEVRDVVRATEGDDSWQKIQGWVYGEGIRGALPFWGVHELLRRCASRNVEVHIVSHKTERGHQAVSEVSLRTAAMEWLIREGICAPAAPAIPSHRIHFADDRERKLEVIDKLGLDAFVDDLPEVLLDPSFPNGTRTIGFRVGPGHPGVEVARSWREVGDLLFGVPTPDEIVSLAMSEAGLERPDGVRVVTTGGNSLAFVVSTGEERFFVKRYPDRQFDRRNRCGTETSALRWMAERDLPVPSLVWADECLGLAVHNHVQGDVVERPTLDDVDRAADFVASLAGYSGDDRLGFDDASEHFGSAVDLLGQVEMRIDHGERSNHPGCAEYFQTELRPRFEHEATALRDALGDQLSAELPQLERTLSPSDFGFHNSLRTEMGLVFVDFEYFGWDDPAKLVADFLLHPGFMSDVESQRRWLSRAESIFGSTVVARVRRILPVVAIRWEAIIMRPFVTTTSSGVNDSEWRRRLTRTQQVRSTALSWS